MIAETLAGSSVGAKPFPEGSFGATAHAVRPDANNWGFIAAGTELSWLKEEVDSAPRPATFARALRHETLASKPRFQLAKYFIEHLEMVFSGRLGRIGLQPLELSANPKALHWRLDHASVPRDHGEEKLAILFPGKDNNPVTATKLGAKLCPHLAGPVPAFGDGFVVESLFVGIDHIIGSNQAVLGG